MSAYFALTVKERSFHFEDAPCLCEAQLVADILRTWSQVAIRLGCRSPFYIRKSQFHTHTHWLGSTANTITVVHPKPHARCFHDPRCDFVICSKVCFWQTSHALKGQHKFIGPKPLLPGGFCKADQGIGCQLEVGFSWGNTGTLLQVRSPSTLPWNLTEGSWFGPCS